MAEHCDFYRVLVLGESGVGKTSLVQRYVFDVYSEGGPQAGRDEERKTVRFRNGHQVELKICDTAGQERVDLLTGQFYQNANAIIFVYDITDARTLWHADTWIRDWKIHIDNFHSIPVLFVGNKCDVPRPSELEDLDDPLPEPVPDDEDRGMADDDEEKEFVSLKQVKTLVKTHNFISTPLECSARTGKGVAKVFETVAAELAMIKPSKAYSCVCL